MTDPSRHLKNFLRSIWVDYQNDFSSNVEGSLWFDRGSGFSNLEISFWSSLSYEKTYE